MKTATLALMVRGKRILLGLKRGEPEIGKGTYNGPGGKWELGESLLNCMYRETWEEVRMQIHRDSAKEIALIIFFAGGVPDFAVHVYRITRWKGRPRKTASMIPSWHDRNHLPFHRMLASDKKWFARAARGKKLRANVYYRERAKGFIGIW